MKRSEAAKKIFGGVVSIMLLWALSPSGVCADIPSKINYQGYLTDFLGTSISTTVSIQFSIYDVVTGGTPLWSETQDVTVTAGILSVELGTLSPLNLAFDIPYYLGIKVGTTDPEMAPRKPLTAVSYAFRAKSV